MLHYLYLIHNLKTPVAPIIPAFKYSALIVLVFFKYHTLTSGSLFKKKKTTIESIKAEPKWLLNEDGDTDW